MTVGDRIRQRRRNLDITQRTLAAAAGLDHRKLNRIELGRQVARVDDLARIARALKISPCLLLGERAA